MGKSKCTCLSEVGEYELVHTLDRSDNPPTYWLWSAGNGVVREKNISFNALYPARLLGLSMKVSHDDLTFPVEQNATVSITCTWDAGNPPVQARLLDSGGTTMATTPDVDGTIRYNIMRVSCLDAGLFHCQAPRATENKTATLLVRCKPDIRFEGFISNPSMPQLQVSVRAHTTTMRDCKVTKLSDSHGDGLIQNLDAVAHGFMRVRNCSSVAASNGTLPEARLIVSLDTVESEQDEMTGKWRLELTNDAGTGYLDFDLRLPSETEQNRVPVRETSSSDTSLSRKTTSQTTAWQSQPTKLVPTENPSVGSAPIQVYITGIIAAAVVVGLIIGSITIIVVIVVCVKKVNTNIMPAAPFRHRNEDMAMLPVPPVRDTVRPASDFCQISNHYEEIPEGPPLPARGVLRSTRYCRAPREDPDGYLHPSSSLPELNAGIRTSGNVRQIMATTSTRTINTMSPHSHQSQLYQKCSSSPVKQEYNDSLKNAF